MNAMNRGISAYRAAQRTVPPLVAVVMLYDTALLHIATAAEAAEGVDVETQFNEITKAVRILSGLKGNLNFDKGGKVARSLRDMYDSVSHALLRSVGRPDSKLRYEKLMRALRETRDAWASIAYTSQPTQTAMPASRLA